VAGLIYRAKKRIRELLPDDSETSHAPRTSQRSGR
jgi:hypothetical protein